MSIQPTSPGTQGLLLGLGAYCAWGLMPLYFIMVREIPAWQMLSHRVAWSFLFLLTLIISMDKWKDLRTIWTDRKTLWILAITAFLIAGNWLFYIIAVSTRQVQQASIGYYVSPVLSVFMGMAFLGEKMRAMQWISLFVAMSGATHLTWTIGTIPILAIGLALTFSLYGMLRKIAAVDAVAGLAWETTILLPFGVAGIITAYAVDKPAFTVSPQGFWVASSGIITILPLLLFTAASRRLPLVIIGFFQYLSPTIQLIIATLLLNEHLDEARLPGFIMIWLALCIFVADTYIMFIKGKNENIPV